MAECWFSALAVVWNRKRHHHSIERPWFSIRFVETFTVYLQPIWSYKRFFVVDNGGMSISAIRGRSWPEMTSPFHSLTSILYRWTSEILYPSLTIEKPFNVVDLVGKWASGAKFRCSFYPWQSLVRRYRHHAVPWAKSRRLSHGQLPCVHLGPAVWSLGPFGAKG